MRGRRAEDVGNDIACDPGRLPSALASTSRHNLLLDTRDGWADWRIKFRRCPWIRVDLQRDVFLSGVWAAVYTHLTDVPGRVADAEGSSVYGKPAVFRLDVCIPLPFLTLLLLFLSPYKTP